MPAPRPVVLFLPARDEEASVGAVVGRAPATCAVTRCRCSSSTTARPTAAAAGPRAPGAVVTANRRRGLGAAVRTGSRRRSHSTRSRSRSATPTASTRPRSSSASSGRSSTATPTTSSGPASPGRIRRMHPHRRFGNRVLTAARRVAHARARHRRAERLSRAVGRGGARAAEIIHDYNYAQVLTLDLVRKGFRYAEVPISYRFRARGPVVREAGALSPARRAGGLARATFTVDGQPVHRKCWSRGRRRPLSWCRRSRDALGPAERPRAGHGGFTRSGRPSRCTAISSSFP